MKKGQITKAHTTYYVHLKPRQDTVYIAVNEEVKDHISIYSELTPCSGVLTHWGTRAELKKELLELVEILDRV
jgi:hypothetical protein